MFTQQGHHHLHEEFLHQQHFLPCPPPFLPSSSSSTNLNNMIIHNNNNSSRPNTILTDRWKPSIEIAPNCPRCDSSNTKFCYYNNYSLTQPRYFCKGCRRYWTKGGSLRNVPVGGGCRKNRRGKSVRISSNHRSTSPGNSPFRSGGGGTNSVDDPSHDPLDNSTSRLDNSSSSAAVAAATTTTIDLALVYAKYLNQQPDSSSNNSQAPADQFSRDNNMNQFDDSPSLDFSSINSEPIHETHIHQFSSSSSLEQCNMVALSPADPSPETQLSTTTEGSQQQQQHQQQQVFLGEVMELNHFNQNESRLIVPPFSNLEPNSCSGSYLLQPLLVPSEDSILQDHLWLNSPVLGSNNFSWHNQAATHFEPMIDHHHSTFHSNPLESSWSSFDLPSFEAFPRQ